MEKIEKYKKLAKKIILNVENAIKDHIGEKKSGDIVQMGADGTPTKKIDMIAEKQVIKTLAEENKPIFLISEEVGELKINGSSIENVIISKIKDDKERKYPIFITDPLDGTSNAVKGLSMYGISVSIAKFPKNNKAPTLDDVEYGIVKNFADGDVFEACKNKGATFNGEKPKLSDEKYLSNVTLSGFIYGKSIAPVNTLLRSVRRLRLLGSVAVEMSYIANGRYDTFIDLRGSKVIDISAAKLIVEESGGVVTNFEGRRLRNKLEVKGKTPVIATNNEGIHKKIMKIYQSDRQENQETTRIGITSRIDKAEAIETCLKVIDYLENKGIELFIDESFSEKTGKHKDKAMPLEEIDADMIIALGGDGTILRTQRYINKNRIPILGINQGTVGFLTEVDPENIKEALDDVIEGNYKVEKRSRLNVYHDKELPLALNEVVLMTERPAKMLHMEIYVDGKLAEVVRADGLIVATPSGSTAYAMSAGGPIIDPKVNAFIVIPICPYKLDIRALVVSDESQIKVKLSKKGKDAVAIVDGQYSEKINYPDEIYFQKAKEYTYLVNLGQNFYENVKRKLI